MGYIHYITNERALKFIESLENLLQQLQIDVEKEDAEVILKLL